MKLTVLGSGSLIPVPKRGNSGYFLQTGQHNILIDGGSGTLGRMANFDLNHREIDVITYSHLHPDHTFDLVPLLFSFKHDSRVTMPRSLKIIAPSGFRNYFDRLMDIYGEWVLPAGLKVEIEEVFRNTVRLKDVDIATRHTEHTEHSVTFRFSGRGGGDFFYSGDTDMCQELIDNARGADLLLLECSFPDEDRHKMHLTPTLCGKIASETGSRRLILTHFYPEVLETDIKSTVSKYFKGKIDLAYDGMEVEV